MERIQPRTPNTRNTGEDGQEGRDQDTGEFWFVGKVTVTYNKQSIHMDSGVWRRLHLLEYCQGWLVVGTELEDVAQVQGRLLEVTVGLQDLPKLRQGRLNWLKDELTLPGNVAARHFGRVVGPPGSVV